MVYLFIYFQKRLFLVAGVCVWGGGGVCGLSRVRLLYFNVYLLHGNMNAYLIKNN